MLSLDEISHLDTPSEAIEELDLFIPACHTDVDADELHEALMLRGKLLWRVARRAEAIADYRRALAIRPDGPARAALEIANDIFAFHHSDLLNP